MYVRDANGGRQLKVHDKVRIPKKRIFVEVCSWIKRKVVTLLPVSGSIDIHICLKCDRIPTCIPQELEVHLIMRIC